MSLNHSPISLVRSLKGAPLACLFILLIEGEARRAGALCQSTGYSSNSITAALRLLADMHLIVKTPDGWYIPVQLRDAMLNRQGSLASIVNRDVSSSYRDSTRSGGGDSDSSNLDYPPPPSDRSAQFAQQQSQHQILGISTGDLPSQTDIARILDATRLLFGERLHGPPSRYPDMRLLLATIAEAYTRRHSLRKPARVAYANLKRGVDPGSEFLDDPLIHLPGSFLEAAGLPFHPPAGDTLVGEELPGEIVPHEDPLPEPHPSLSLPADAQSRRSAAQVWEIALETLRLELPRHVFHSHLEACDLATYDPVESVFTLVAPDEQASLWLKDRLSAKLTRLLTGICDRPCSVRFEVLP
jgi:hypothetical protein